MSTDSSQELFVEPPQESIETVSEAARLAEADEPSPSSEEPTLSTIDRTISSSDGATLNETVTSDSSEPPPNE